MSVNDERISETQASCPCRHIHADCIRGDERRPEQPRRIESVIEIVDLRAVQAREEIKSNQGKAALALFAILTHIGSRHEPHVGSKRHTRLAIIIRDRAGAVPGRNPDASFEVADR